MAGVLVDSNVLLDVLEEEQEWFEWSAAALSDCTEQSMLIINPLIFAEVSVGFETIEALDAALPPEFFQRRSLPWEAAFLAAKCFVRYRRAGGNKRAPLPDFYIGAHAAVESLSLLTRDGRRYRTYFPSLDLITPEA